MSIKYNEPVATFNDWRYRYDGSLVNTEILAPRKNAKRVDAASRPASLSTGKRTWR